MDEYIAEHKAGDVVTGRVVEVSGGSARVELGEGLQAPCRLRSTAPAEEESKSESKADLSSLTSMLQARWKGGAGSTTAAQPEAIRAGQVRSFRIAKLDADSKTIALELA